jgi:hypothetical protein
VANGVTAAAYTNNDLNQPATGTTLFDIDTMLDQIVVQSPPGNGILVATAQLGFDGGARAGLDIYSRLLKGVTVSNHAFATFVMNGRAALFGIDLLSGRSKWLGRFDDAVVDIALTLDQ